MKGVGRALFVAILLIIAGALNIIYGFGAIGNASFFTASHSYVFANLHTWGWITVILGIIQLTGGISLWTGGGYGRVIGIVGARIGGVRGPAGGGRQLPLLVAGRVRPVPVDPARADRARRGRGRITPGRNG